MGHQIISEVSSGNCRLTRCSCGRGAFQMGKKVMLVSAKEAEEMAALLGAKGSSTAERLNRLAGGNHWVDFSPGN